jgi:hypothetical protein
MPEMNDKLLVIWSLFLFSSVALAVVVFEAIR